MPDTPAPPGTLVHVRWMIRRDMPAVLAIESTSFDHPWLEDHFLRELRLRNTIGMVAEVGEKVVGFMVYQLHKTHLTIADFAVHPNYREQGVGRQMIAKLIDKLSPHRRVKIDTILRESNLDGHLFLRSMGFVATAIEREAFPASGDDEDGYRFEYHLETAGGSPEDACVGIGRRGLAGRWFSGRDGTGERGATS